MARAGPKASQVHRLPKPTALRVVADPTPEYTVCLRTGGQVRIRSVQRDDRPQMLQFMTQLDPRSRQLRFFTAGANLTAAAAWATSADGSDHVGLVALDEVGQLAGHAACCRMCGRRAEVSVEISDQSRHQGLATILIAELARRAETLGIDTFIAEVLPENHDMLAVFHDEFDARQRRLDGEFDIEFPTSAWRRADHLQREGWSRHHLPIRASSTETTKNQVIEDKK